MMLKVVNTTVLKTTLFVNFIPLQPLGLFITTLLVLQSRDGVQWFLHLYFPQTMGFENFTSIENILAALFETVYQVQSVIYTCRHNHVHQMNNSYSLVLMHGAGHYNSTSEWSL